MTGWVRVSTGIEVHIEEEVFVRVQQLQEVFGGRFRSDLVVGGAKGGGRGHQIFICAGSN